MNRLITITAALLMAGCSYYDQGYTETRHADGAVTWRLEQTNVVPPLGKDASTGRLASGADGEGGWELSANHAAETDLGGQRALIDGLVSAYTGQAQRNARLEAENQQLRQTLQRMQQQINAIAQRQRGDSPE